MGRDNLAIYIHWPFCQAKCPYCDFNSYAREGAGAGVQDEGAWREAYGRELEHYARLLPQRRVSSVFFGGGTPSLMEAETVGFVLDKIAGLWGLGADVEVTLEANPGSSEAGRFSEFRAAGVNRLSLGVQALREEDLRFLGRVHSVKEALHALDLARKIFPRFSFDLIYARRGQNLPAWERELREAVALVGDHLSLYQLTIEPNTAFHTRAVRGEALTAEETPSVEMYELTQAVMGEAGLPAYEISNHARAGQESRHNLTYWRYGDYLGIGPGAHGRYVAEGGSARLATDNHRMPEVWMRQVHEQGQGARQVQPLDHDTARREAVMMGLRLARGIERTRWQEMFTMPLGVFLPEAKREKLMREGYWREDDEAMGLTAAGLQRLNAVLGYLLA